MQYHKIIFENLSETAQEALVARLSEFGINGFEQLEDQLIAYADEALIGLPEFNDFLKNIGSTYREEIIQEQNWNAQWESDFQPVHVESLEGQRRLTIRAEFHEPDAQSSMEIIITPKMSFGTGHHATTYQMAQQMFLLDINGKKVLDFGTGTGVLAILAEKRGADKILAIDYDEWCIENSRENITKNSCQRITLMKADHCMDDGDQYDLILANINLNIIVSNLNNIKKLLHPNGLVLFSGILESDWDSISHSVTKHGFEIIHKNSLNNWLVIKAGHSLNS